MPWHDNTTVQIGRSALPPGADRILRTAAQTVMSTPDLEQRSAAGRWITRVGASCLADLRC
ncbi:hypothetical protein ACGFJ5_10460 [Micromonospora echinaurantiaca]|uniref:hypothetical protein n=1 Tax=Micromonospora echinaurantiaca TaxID=47857 RepID=UPI00371EC57E